MNIVLSYKELKVRTVDKNGQLWFILKDICDILGISNPSMASKALDDDERAKFDLGRQGQATIINESGLYALILRSDKIEAKEFKRWVTHDVLPSIRKYGFYFNQAWTMSTKTIARLTGYSHNVALKHIADALPQYRSAILTGRATKDGLELNALHAYIALTKLGRGGVHFYIDQFPAEIQAICDNFGTRFEA